MSDPSIQACNRCGRDLPPGALACPLCHALVHADDLYRITANANALEAKQDFAGARELWVSGLKLLPRDAKQAIWIRDHLENLPHQESHTEVGGGEGNPWVRRLGPVGLVLAFLAKGKSLLVLLKFKFLFSLGTFVAVYWSLFGAAFGVGFAVLILLHEMGHYIDVKRRGLPAEMPVFLPGLGAYVKWQALGVSLQTRAAVSLAGPLAGFVSALACVVIWWQTGSPLWAALGRTGAWLNMLNLIPVWQLDGGQAVKALNKADRIALLLVTIGLCVALREKMLLLVAAGVVWQLFDKEMPVEQDRKTLLYFSAVLACLAVLLWLVPAQFDAP